MKISMVIPTCNGAQYIPLTHGQALSCVMAAAVTGFVGEHITLENGRTHGKAAALAHTTLGLLIRNPS